MTDINAGSPRDSNNTETDSGNVSEVNADTGDVPKNPINDRDSWGHELEFLFSCIALSVGLGNVWRFPFVALGKMADDYVTRFNQITFKFHQRTAVGHLWFLTWLCWFWLVGQLTFWKWWWDSSRRGTASEFTTAFPFFEALEWLKSFQILLLQPTTVRQWRLRCDTSWTRSEPFFLGAYANPNGGLAFLLDLTALSTSRGPMEQSHQRSFILCNDDVRFLWLSQMILRF